MPITINLKHDPYYNQGLTTGLQKGLQKGKAVILKEMGFNEEEICKRLNILKKELNNLLKG
jgi:hypothetical protein